MNSDARVLVVEDDDTLREALCDTIEFGGYRALSAVNGVEALSRMSQEPVDMVISDVQMDEMDGHRLLREVRSRQPQMPFVMITAHGSVRDAVDAMRDGATDYLLKPFEAEVLLEMVARMEPSCATHMKNMIAEDPLSRELCAMARRVAESDATVLISGESGSGKEVLARFIHDHSTRAAQPFLAVNCAAIPENMLESMLFGYEKGAYTGAYQSRPGKFEQANGGTLLLDEISEMDLSLQAKLLRVLQEREVERLGGNKLIPLDVRVLATTNRQLELEVGESRFREDLFYRLSVFPLHLPPLRERRGDILPLAQRFLQNHADDRPLQLGEDAQALLLGHHWRGNVRELENCMQRAAILAPAAEVRGSDIVLGNGPMDQALQAASAVAAAATVTAESPGASSALAGGLKQREHDLILNALRSCNGSRKDAAIKLGISPRTLRYKLAKLRDMGIEAPEARGDTLVASTLLSN